MRKRCKRWSPLRLSLALAANLEAERAALDSHWQLRLERAR
jgi:hypothetical protein